MSRKRNKYGLRTVSKPVFILGILASICCGYIAGGAAGQKETIFTWYEKLQEMMHGSIDIETVVSWYNGKYTLMAIACMLIVYGLVLLYYMAGDGNYMPGAEYGNAQWADNDYVNKCLSKPLNLKNRDTFIAVKRKKRSKLWQLLHR